MSQGPKQSAKPRPTQYTPELGDLIVQRYANGYDFSRMSREFEDLPVIHVLQAWLQEIPNLASRIAGARELHAASLVAEALQIADTDFDTARARNRFQMRQWIASKLAPATYGDKLDVTVNKQISITAALTDARARIARPVSDQLDTIEGQAIEITKEMLLAPSDKQSADEDEIDIFS